MILLINIKISFNILRGLFFIISVGILSADLLFLSFTNGSFSSSHVKSSSNNSSTFLLIRSWVDFSPCVYLFASNNASTFLLIRSWVDFSPCVYLFASNNASTFLLIRSWVDFSPCVYLANTPV